MTHGANPERKFDDDILSDASFRDEPRQEEINETIVRVSPSYEDCGKYLIKLSGLILANLDEIYEALDTSYKKEYGLWEKKRDLETACCTMATAGAWIWKNEFSLEREIGAGPAFMKGQIIDGTFVAQEIDWDELALFLKKEGYRYTDKFIETHGFQISAFEGAPTSLQIIGESILESTYESDLPFLPSEISLSVKPISQTSMS